MKQQDPRFQPIPTDKSQRVKRLARDLAYGVLVADWSSNIGIDTVFEWSFSMNIHHNEQKLINYLRDFWEGQLPDLQLLEDMRYIKRERSAGDDVTIFRLTESALQLGTLKGE